MIEFIEELRTLFLVKDNLTITSITLPSKMYSSLCAQLASINLNKETLVDFSNITLCGIRIYFTSEDKMNIGFK